ncbi:hypothetical protein ACH5RR_027972 [Cinchona calisaya]|uniref:Uncharacterized protein n=1 Tax=Cinchona calisaya TaxID=153742 RepID=A0ABD2YPK0_9GENT
MQENDLPRCLGDNWQSDVFPSGWPPMRESPGWPLGRIVSSHVLSRNRFSGIGRVALIYEGSLPPNWVLSLMEGFPLYGGDGCGPSSSKGPRIDLNLPPRPEPEQEPPETSPEEEERRRDWEELRASKEYKESERHLNMIEGRIKDIKGRAREIAQERGFSPEKCDAVEDAAEYIADDVHNQEGWFEDPLVKGKMETGELADKDGQ